MKLLITRPLPFTVLTAARARVDVTARTEPPPSPPDAPPRLIHTHNAVHASPPDSSPGLACH